MATAAWGPTPSACRPNPTRRPTTPAGPWVRPPGPMPPSTWPPARPPRPSPSTDPSPPDRVPPMTRRSSLPPAGPPPAPPALNPDKLYPAGARGDGPLGAAVVRPNTARRDLTLIHG